ncbi:hypothetical protein EYF80_041515 [Liparis tanakae]|uniref:Uncharacterized protein n=1 Tax=Liparis tanakae TaxID=230148 RepID=A0A4Z2G5F8_9TELE|nr:hypothetical protein EYF80_041515 [Liparis tanakae]
MESGQDSHDLTSCSQSRTSHNQPQPEPFSKQSVEFFLSLIGTHNAVLTGARHGVNFPLAVDRPSVLLPRHRQECVGGLVTEADGLLALPHGPPTLNCPLIQVVPFPFVAEGTHFLWSRGKEMRRKEMRGCFWDILKSLAFPDIEDTCVFFLI